MKAQTLLTSPGGWDRITEEFPKDLGKEVDQAFDNAVHALKKAGGKGWEQVYFIRGYIAPKHAQETHEHVIRNIKKHFPDHAPAFTGIWVHSLFRDMNLEMEIKAHVGNS